MKKIILASASPRRSCLLLKAGIEFEAVPPVYDENISNTSFSYKKVENNARYKGLSILQQVDSGSIILSADTVVVYNNIIIGKPKDYDDAARILKKLSGHTHRVVTSVCFIDSGTGRSFVKSETSEVTFNELSDDMIKDYILKFQPYDKAGAYGIQELDSSFVKETKGSLENIAGLPVNLVKTFLQDAGLL